MYYRAPQSVRPGEKATKPADPTRDGYDFDEWTLGGKPFDFDTEITSDITLEGTWTRKSYKVTFNDGTTETEVPVNHGELVTKPADPTKEGYTFGGWTLNGTDYDFSTAVTADITLIAKWTANSYTITFDTDGGSTIAPITKAFGEAVTAPANPTKTGYKFISWDKAIPSKMPAANTTIKAQWKTNQYTITLIVDDENGTEKVYYKKTYDYGAGVSAPAADPTRKGCTFDGWDTVIPATMPAEDLTIRAMWTLNRHSVTFDTDGGSAVAPIRQDCGTKITAPAAPTKNGYTFNGWNPALPATMPDHNMTVKAQWTSDTPAPAPSPAPVMPVVPGSSTPSSENEPKIEGGNGVSGWNSIKNEITNAKAGDTIVVDMNGTTTLPKDIIGAISGKDINIVLDMGNGVSWTINGNSVTSASSNINMGVTVGNSGIPVDVINNITGEKYSMVISLSHNGEFGFTATLTVGMKKENAGRYANLFWYDKSNKKLEFVCSGLIDKDGNVALTFTHASDYTIVVDDHSLAESTITATIDGSSATLKWDAVPYAQSYNVYVVKDGKWVKLKTTGKTSLTVSKLTNNKTYRFMVRAKVDGKLVSKTDAYQLKVKICYKPVLKAIVKGTKITLKWSEVNNATKYGIYKYSGGKWELVKTVKKLTCSITGKSGKTYRYAVRAFVNGKWTSIGTVSKATIKVK